MWQQHTWLSGLSDAFAVGVLRPVGKVNVSATMSAITENSHGLRMMFSHLYRHKQ